jgi:hypothetical protein
MNESDKAVAAADGSESGNTATLDIKALLAKEDSNFISLHELLTAIAATGNATYQDAARLLLRRLKNTDSDDCPSWCRLDTNHGIVTMGNHDSSAWACLRQAAKEGEPRESEFDDDIPF